MRGRLKFKKLILANLIIFIIGVLFSSNVVTASQMNYSFWFELAKFYNAEEKTGYSLDENGKDIIYNIIKYEDNNGNAGTNYEEGNFFSVKESIKIPEEEKIKYTNNYDLNLTIEESGIKTELIANGIPSSLSGIIIEENGTYHYNYNVLALCDLLYLNKENNEETIKEYEKQAKIYNSEDKNLNYNDFLTKEDIKAIQQLAFWYFTDNKNTENGFENIDNSDWAMYYYNKNTTKYNKFDNNTVGEQKKKQAFDLYKYLIETAQTNAQEYKDGIISLNNKITLYTSTTNIENTPPIILIEEGKEKQFDLALREFISEINGKKIITREPEVDTQNLNSENNGQPITTAEYNHSKEPLEVITNSSIKYNLSVYNEGDKKGLAKEIKSQLPAGVILDDNINKNGETITSSKGNTYQINYVAEDNIITFKLDENEKTININPYKENNNLDLDIITFNCKVVASPDTNSEKVLTNFSWISEEYDSESRITIKDKQEEDRDSEPGNNQNGQQDDEDFEKMVLNPKEFDLKLIERVTAINNNPIRDRIIGVEAEGIMKGDQTTSIYKVEKEQVSVRNGDIVTYTFRIYNEGEIDGYASEITKEIPEGLQFIYSELTDEELENETSLSSEEKNAIKYNRKMEWAYKDSSLTNINTDYLAKEKGEEINKPNANIIKALDKNKDYINKVNDRNPDYKEVSVMLRVVADDASKAMIRSEAAITKTTDSEGKDIKDRDSNVETWNKEISNKYYDDNQKWPCYTEDDEDYEIIKLESFDLSIKTFVSSVNEEKTKNREPEVNYDLDKNKLVYSKEKKPLEVLSGDIIKFKIRVYNEGEVNGFASEISENIPEGLEYLPNHMTNKQYKWTMYDSDNKQTDDISKAVKLKTNYLSKKQGEIIKSKSKLDINNPVLLTAFDSSQPITSRNPSCSDIEIVFKVIEPNKSDKEITNIVQISENTDEEGKIVKDVDSTPDELIENEDDQASEKIKLTYFDLSISQKITQAITKEQGQASEAETEYKKDKDSKEILKVNLEKNKLDKQEVKLKYSIKVTNDGKIAGSAKKITDYIPEGFEFLEEDNKGWKNEGNNIISNSTLENKILHPGESTELTLVLTWINSKENLGEKNNIVKISEDFNKKNVEDIDIITKNQEQIAGDINTYEIPVLISTSSTGIKQYIIISIIILSTIIIGLVLIKKFVL